MGKVSAALYAVGTLALLPASVLLFPTDAAHQRASIITFIGATSVLTLAALVDAAALAARGCQLRQRRRQQQQRRRRHDAGAPLLHDDLVDGGDGAGDFDRDGAGAGAGGGGGSGGLTWREIAATVAMVAGGGLFLAGSVLFWPPLKLAAPGVWVFRFGSIAYLCGSLLVVGSTRGTTRLAVCSYIVGALLYIAGGIFSEAGLPAVSFATAWLLGSVLFALGGSLLLWLALHPKTGG